jgi:hypothetical protein
MDVGKRILAWLSGFLALAAGILAIIVSSLLKREKPTTPGTDPLPALEEKRKAEEERIREEIHSDTDAQLAERFNSLASLKKDEEKKG